MAYYIREPKHAIGRLYPHGFVSSAPLVMHDECAHGEIAGDPWNDPEESWLAREAFTAPMGAGFDLCWSPVWSLDPDTDPCYCCGRPVVGRG
jgi:hypothetical protein